MSPETNSRKGGSLAGRIVLVVFLGVSLPIVIVSYLSLIATRNTLVQDWNMLQTQIGQSVSSLVSAQIRGSLADLAAVESGLRDESGYLNVPSALTGKAAATLQSYLEGGGRPVSLELRDMQGKGTQTGPQIKHEILAQQIQEAYRAARSSGRPVLSPPVFVEKLNQQLFVVARPLLNAKIQAGVLLAVINLEPLLNAIRENSWPGLRISIVDQNGKLFADLDRNRISENQDYSENEIVKALLTNVRGLGTITRPFMNQSSGQEMIGSGAFIPETGWVVLSQIPKSEAYGGIPSIIWKAALLTAGVLLFSLAITLYLSHRMVQPLRRLAESVRQVSDGNYEAAILIEDTSEIGAMAESFREMTRQVRENLSNMKLAVEDSKQLFTGTVRAFANAIDGKDPYTRGHTERVSRFSVEIAKIMELSEAELETIKIGGLLHDIGKISIDDKILKKPSVLTDDEYQIMKTHPARGYEMMKQIPQLKDIIPGMYSHHEQLDGKGYPQGLKGDEIPMIARIIMVADCFDAMTTKRPYQDPAPTDYVLGIIRSLSGKKYDERVVEALVRGVKTGRIIPHTAT